MAASRPAGKAKPRKKPGFGPAAAAKRPAKPNPFELKKTKSKFSVLGRKNKGQLNVVKARQEANTKVRSVADRYA